MNRLVILILIFIYSACVNSQAIKIYTNANEIITYKYYPYIVAVGESNIGGEAKNIDALPIELAIREKFRIFNNINKLFEPLDIGTNNLLLHTGKEADAATDHGNELAMANSIYTYRWGNIDSIYEMKCGHGGTRTTNWVNDVAYSGMYPLDTFIMRNDTALKILNTLNIDYKPLIFMSIGINDAVLATDTAVFYTELFAMVDTVEHYLGDTAMVFITEIPNNSQANININEKITRLANNDNRVIIIDTDGADMEDVYHWSYAGWKNTIVPNFLDSLFKYWE